MLELILIHGLSWLSAAIPVSIAGTSLLFFPLLSLWILGGAWTFKRWPAEWGTIEKCFVAFVVVSAVSSLFGINIRHGFYEIWKKDFYFMVYMLFLAVGRRAPEARRYLMIFWVGSIVAAALGILQFVLGVQASFHPDGAIAQFLAHGPAGLVKIFALSHGRSAGPRSHPIRYSECLLFALTMSVSFLGIADRRKRWMWLAGAWVMAAAILLSQTRGTWIALVVILIIAFVFERKRLNLSHAMLFVVPVVFLLATSGLRARFATIWSKDNGSNVERLHMWHAGWEIFKQYPLLGVGPGNIRPVVVPYEVGEERTNGGWGHLHNIYVTFAAERGSLGLLALLLLLTRFFVPLWKVLKMPDADPELRAFCLSAFLGAIGFMLCGLTEMDYNNADVLISFYFVMGTTLALIRAASSLHSEF